MKKIILEYGVFLFMCLLGFFLFMAIVGLVSNVNLRYFNSIIHLAIIYMAINTYYSESKSSSINYLKGITVGMLTSLFGISIFVAFQVVHLYFNASFLQEIQSTVMFANEMNPLTIGLAIFAEGLVMSFIGSYLIVRYIESYSQKPYIS